MAPASSPRARRARAASYVDGPCFAGAMAASRNAAAAPDASPTDARASPIRRIAACSSVSRCLPSPSDGG